MLYGVVSFLDAFTLFFMQPLLGKALTPFFGGGAQVWITCMLFFQGTLLVGYAYAHGLVRHGSPRTQAWVHGGLLVLVAGILAYRGVAHGNPLLPVREDMLGEITPMRVLSLLTRCAALPLVLLSATSPLTQAWYGRLFQDRVPYRLYALSNGGSLAGLLLYPFLAERWLTTGSQAWWIYAAMLVFMAGMLLLGLRMTRFEPVAEASAPTAAPEPIPASRPWLWLLASASGSVVLMATTNVLATDVATIPLLWILPLALYLLSFVLVFENRWPGGPASKLLQWLPPLMACLPLLAYGQSHLNPKLMILACSGLTFFGAMTCHGYLYQLKPGSHGLTRFYLVIAVGGILGGLLVALLAPLLVNRLYELGLAVGLVGLCGLLWQEPGGRPRLMLAGRFAALLCVGVGAWNVRERALEPGQFIRNFFGTVRVARGARYITMNHGATLHGAVSLDRPHVPLAYYGADSGIGRVLEHQGRRRPAMKVGVVGLGLGTVASYGRPGDVYRCYEINPAVIAIASAPLGGASYLRNSKARIELVEGDARIQLDQERAQGNLNGFDVLLIDAFSADSVPWHLLTEEAFRSYLAHLAPGGILALHVSNALSVDRVAITSAKAHDLYGAMLVAWGNRPRRGEPDPLLMDNQYIVLAREHATLQTPLILETAAVGFGPKTYRGQTEFSRDLRLLPGGQPWRDDKNSLSDLLFPAGN